MSRSLCLSASLRIERKRKALRVVRMLTFRQCFAPADELVRLFMTLEETKPLVSEYIDKKLFNAELLGFQHRDELIQVLVLDRVRVLGGLLLCQGLDSFGMIGATLVTNSVQHTISIPHDAQVVKGKLHNYVSQWIHSQPNQYTQHHLQG